MKPDSLIGKFKTKKAKVSYRDDDGKYHVLFGWLVGETKDSFVVKTDGFGDDIVLPKKQIVIISWLKPRPRPRPRLPVEGKRRRGFSYAQWWRHDKVEEAPH